MARLLDTNILSELRPPKPEPKVMAFITNCRLDQLYISAMTLSEIRFGIHRVSEPRRTELNAWLNEFVRPMFVGRVLPSTEDIMLLWRILLEDGRKAGHTYSQPDLIIAATALHHNFTVVARDRSEYDHAGVPVLNPWD